MTPDRLRSAGEALFGPRWQSDLAAVLGVHRDTVRSWARGRTAISAGAAAEIRGLLAARRDEIDAALAV